MQVETLDSCKRHIEGTYKELSKKSKNLCKKTYILLEQICEINDLCLNGYKLKKIKDKLWEIKKDNIRICYFLKTRDTIYLLYLFVKKTKKMPIQIIDFCLEKIKEIQTYEI